MSVNQESDEKQMENSNLKQRQQRLFNHLSHVLDVSREKFDKEKAANAERLKWGRLIVSAVEAYGKLLSSTKLEELEDRVVNLEVKNQPWKY